MKVRSISPYTYPKSGAGMRTKYKSGASAYESMSEVSKDNQINTTGRMSSAGRASFKGGSIQEPLFYKMVKFAERNPITAEAIFALAITCTLRPAVLMAFAKDDEDREKRKYQAIKSITSGALGLVTAAIVSKPIADAIAVTNQKGTFKIPEEVESEAKAAVQKGVAVLQEYAESHNDGLAKQIGEVLKETSSGFSINLSKFKEQGKHAQQEFLKTIREKVPDIYKDVENAIKNQKVLDNYSGTAKNVMEKLLQPPFLIARSILTVAAVPVLLKLLGQQKPGSKKEAEKNPQVMLNYSVFENSNEKELFQSFSGVANHENK